ncbi:MAG: tetratricopeptide repeat protein [Deltaproteobacteria bacterium]|nr:tetratricopeptide repeat protein [Deltaproteobacteria bacterium]
MRWYFGVLGSLILFAGAAAQAGSAAREQALKRALAEFEQGGYGQTVAILDQLGSKDRTELPILYWSGLAKFKLQAFDDAIRRLSKVVQGNSERQFADAAFVLGQSYYATQQFREARKAFQQSLSQKYKPGASLYYIGYCDNLLGNDEKALASYSRILALGPKEDDMKQSAQLQIGDLYYERARNIKDEKKQRDAFLKNVAPAYDKTASMKAGTTYAEQAKLKAAQIRARFRAPAATETSTSQIPHTASGAARPINNFVLRVTQDVKYDSNLTNQSDGKLNKVAYTGSGLEKTSLNAKYELLFSDWVVVTPELAFDMTVHQRQDDANIFPFDNTNTAPAVRARLDHKLWTKPAAVLLETEYQYATRDYTGKHTRFSFYTMTNNFIAGERFDYFSIGSTTVKGNLKLVQNESNAQNMVAPGLDLSQVVAVGRGYSINVGGGFEVQRAKNEFFDQRTYRANVSHSRPNLFWGTNVDVALSMSLTDTMHQDPARGTEKNFSPSFTFTKNTTFLWNVSFGANYTFTRNLSSDKANYDYGKHVFGINAVVTL